MSIKMKIAVLAPICKSDICQLLTTNFEDLPYGYDGAPFIGTLIAQLLSEGHTVIGITTDSSLPQDSPTLTFENNSFTWKVIPSRKNPYNWNGSKVGKIMDLFKFERGRLLQAVLDSAPEFVHAHWSYEFAWAAIDSKFPHLITVHDNPYQIVKYTKSLYRLLRLVMAEWVLHRSRHISTVSPYMEKFCLKRNKNLKIIPNPLPLNFIISTSPKEYILDKESDQGPSIAMIMNGWDKRKNGENGLSAFRIVQQLIPSTKLLLFGRDTERNGRVSRICSEMKIENVHFGGFVKQEELRKELEKCHVVIHPALEESFGVSLIESMALGIPVIGGENSGAVPWVLDNLNLLVNVTRPKEIAEKVMEVLGSPEDYKRYSAMGIRNVQDRFSAGKVVAEYVKYYEEIMN
jgi:glycosyltransferase involved in cell wall biosynthesis